MRSIPETEVWTLIRTYLTTDCADCTEIPAISVQNPGYKRAWIATRRALAAGQGIDVDVGVNLRKVAPRQDGRPQTGFDFSVSCNLGQARGA
jgi:hypothetical protein